MKAYLQTSESGWEEELKVQIPDPDDDTVVIPITLMQVQKAWLDATSKVPLAEAEPQLWVRVAAEESDLRTRTFTAAVMKVLNQRGRGIITSDEFVGRCVEIAFDTGLA